MSVPRFRISVLGLRLRLYKSGPAGIESPANITQKKKPRAWFNFLTMNSGNYRLVMSIHAAPASIGIVGALVLVPFGLVG
jgi:hypothetical protein